MPRCTDLSRFLVEKCDCTVPAFSIKKFMGFRGLKLSVCYAERIVFRHLLEFYHNMDVVEYERSVKTGSYPYSHDSP